MKTETPGVWPVRYDERTFPPRLVLALSLLATEVKKVAVFWTAVQANVAGVKIEQRFFIIFFCRRCRDAKTKAKALRHPRKYNHQRALPYGCYCEWLGNRVFYHCALQSRALVL